MARWFRGRRKRRDSEEPRGENPPPQVPRSGEGALQPIYPELEPEAGTSEPDASLQAQETTAERSGSGETGPSQRTRKRRRGGRGSAGRREESKLPGVVPTEPVAGQPETMDMVEEDRENTELPALGSDREQTNLDRPGEQDTPAVAPPTAVEASRQRRGRGRGRRRGRRAGKPERSSQPAPLAPAYPEERYQPPVSEVAPDLPAAAAPKAQPAAIPSRQPPKKPRGVVVLTIGLPGSGKSSWFKRRGVSPLSSDMLRALLFDDITEQRYQDLVFSTLRSLLRARLIAGMPWNYIDATNLSPKERHGWIKMAHDFGYEVHAVFFDVPLEVCKERNQRRGRVVPDDVMQRMAHKLRPPTFEEGFSKIIVVRVKHSDKEPQAREESGSRPDAESAD